MIHSLNKSHDKTERMMRNAGDVYEKARATRSSHFEDSRIIRRIQKRTQVHSVYASHL